VRLVSDASDTIIVNSAYATLLPVRAIDAVGRVVAAAPIRFALDGRDSILVSTTGAVTCSRSGDFAVRATTGPLSRRLIVQCRRVENVRMAGPVQFVLGDTALTRPASLRFVAYDSGARPVARVRAAVSVGDTGVVGLQGIVVSPRRRGITWANVRVGERDGGTGVHVYQRVSSLDALDTLLRVRDRQRLFAVPLRMAGGEVLRQRLPPGSWMLALLPETDSSAGRIHLRVQGGPCRDNLLNSPRRWGCDVGPDATVVLYRPLGGAQIAPATEYLLVRWLFQ